MSNARNLSVVPGQTLSFKNRIINGAMVIDQRNAGATVAAPSDGAYVLDRYRMFTNGGGVYSVGQSSTAPAGFTKSMLCTVTTADASISAGDYYPFVQAIEGYNIADLGWGTADAKTVTASFWVRSSVTGTYPFALRNGSGARSYVTTYTISAANTWEYKTITIAGDTTGTWDSTNSSGILVTFDLGSGSTYQGTANTWQAGNFFATSAATKLISTNGATFYITGVQLEKGSTATSFDYRPYGTELALCQRYYEKSYDTSVAVGGVSTNGRITVQAPTSTTFAWINVPFAVVKRTAPTTTFYSPANGTSGVFNNDSTSSNASVVNATSSGTSSIQVQVYPMTATQQYSAQWVATAEL